MEATIRLLISAALSFPLILNMFGVSIDPLWQWALATPVQFYCGYPFYRGILGMGMNTLVGLGTSAAYGYSIYAIFDGRELYFETSAVLVTLILLGRYLEARSIKRAKSGVTALLHMQQKEARLGDKMVPIATIQVGDVLTVLPGETVPVDGSVVEGSAHVDESMLTGESVPIAKAIGAQVYSGTINSDGKLLIKAEKLGSETALGRIIKMVEEAQQSKAPIQKVVSRISRIFVPVVLLIALMTFGLWFAFDAKEAIMNAVAVLVIACPCALGLATPMVIVVATARAAREGILVKNAEGLEMASHLKSLVLDKTGTVTEGQLTVEECTSEQIKIYAKSLTQNSNHPISYAINTYLKDVKPTQVSDFVEIKGRGIEGVIEGKRVFLGRCDVEDPRIVSGVKVDGVLMGYFALSDKIRQGAAQMVARLKWMGITPYLVSGDRMVVVEKVAKELGIDKAFGEVKPECKADKVKSIEGPVGMVGDGINDAPALAVADVGFALGTGTDVAMESASIGLMHADVADAIALSKLTMRKIRQNLFFAFIYNCLGIPIAALGLLNPMIAGAAMGLSSISVVLNSVLLRHVKPLYIKK